MKVICAGAPKTGTKSMAKALRVLSYKVYDHFEALELQMEKWLAVLEGNQKDLSQILDDMEQAEVQAVTDLPYSVFFDSFLQRWPDAKVILMVREEDNWFKSYSEHIKDTEKFWQFYPITRCFSKTARQWMKFRCLHKSAAFGSPDPVAFTWKTSFRRHNAYVQNRVKDNLLIYNVSQGWEPLCKFLGKPIPDVEFPMENAAGTADKICDKFTRETVLTKQIIQEISLFFTIFIGVLCMALGFFVYQ